ncbi:MAG: alanine racemase [Phycisphaerae bacterium]|nr:alanine racemase [Phycisphaerae bacterium]
MPSNTRETNQTASGDRAAAPRGRYLPADASISARPAAGGRGTYLTAHVSAAAVRANLAVLRRAVGPTTALCAVVKADCYGHGLSGLLETLAVEADWLAVSTPAEAIALRDLGYDGPLLMFFSAGALDEADRAAVLRELLARDVTLTVVSSGELRELRQAARAADRPARVHVMVDTGMGRSGAPAGKVAALVADIRAAEGLTLTGLYTHFAVADEPVADAGADATADQMRRFREAVELCRGRDRLRLHAANSAATLTRPQTHLDMVRPGIAVYGYRPNDDLPLDARLTPALRLTGPLMQVKDVPAGGACGYGLTHTFRRDSRIGLVPVGYADGYDRALSNRGVMRVRGRDVPVCGRVSMDQTIVDLTDVPGARVGDAVEIISADAGAPNSVEHIARLCETIPYEVTCRLGGRIRRMVE